MEKGNYDNVALFYDWLAKLVYGNAIEQAHQYLSSFVPVGASVLIVGGGSGNVLANISAYHKAGLEITYVDVSAKMIRLAKKKPIGDNHVTFINAAIQQAGIQKKFDVVMTTFLFDNFSQTTANNVFKTIDELLNEGGLWLFADFTLQSKKVWQPALLKTMHLFFKLLCNVEATKLPDTDTIFAIGQYESVTHQSFFHQFIKAVVYRKNISSL